MLPCIKIIIISYVAPELELRVYFELASLINLDSNPQSVIINVSNSLCLVQYVSNETDPITGQLVDL